MHNVYMFTENTNEIVSIRVAEYVPPRSNSLLELEFYLDRSFETLKLRDFSDEQQALILEVCSKVESEGLLRNQNVIHEFFDVDGQPMYPTLEQTSSPDGWVSFFLQVQAEQQAKVERYRQERFLKNQEILRDIEIWDQMDEMEFFKEHADEGVPWRDSDIFEDETLQARLKKYIDLVDEVTLRFCKEKDLLNRKWVKDFGSAKLQEQVNAYEGLFFAGYYEFEFFNELSADLGLNPCKEPFRSYVLERMQLEHPTAMFGAYVYEDNEYPNPTAEELKRAEELGGKLVLLSEFPDLMEPEEPIEEVLNQLFAPPAVAVSVPVPGGRAVYFLSGKPELDPELRYVIFKIQRARAWNYTEVLVKFHWVKTLLNLKPDIPKQRLSLGFHQICDVSREICLSVVLDASGAVYEGHYLLVDDQGNVLSESDVLTGADLLQACQVVKLKSAEKPVAVQPTAPAENRSEAWELTAIFERLPEDLRDKLRRRLLSEVDPVVALINVIERGLL